MANINDDAFRLLVQSVVDYAIFMLDAEGHVSNWNPGAERIKGYKPSEIVGQHFSRFYTEEDRKRGVPKKALETARKTGKYSLSRQRAGYRRQWWKSGFANQPGGFLTPVEHSIR